MAFLWRYKNSDKNERTKISDSQTCQTCQTCQMRQTMPDEWSFPDVVNVPVERGETVPNIEGWARRWELSLRYTSTSAHLTMFRTHKRGSSHCSPIPAHLPDLIPGVLDTLNNSKRDVEVDGDFSWCLTKHFSLINDPPFQITRVMSAFRD